MSDEPVAGPLRAWAKHEHAPRTTCPECHFETSEGYPPSHAPGCLNTVCQFCGEEILLDEFGVWHHAEDDAIVCAIGLDTDQPGEIAVQYASPAGSPPMRRRV